MKALYGKYANLRPHQLKIIGDLAHPDDENYEFKLRKDSDKNIDPEKILRKGKTFVIYNKFRIHMNTIHEKIESLRFIGKLIKIF